MFAETNQPAACERVVDSIRGVFTQGFLVFEGDMIAIFNGVDLLSSRNL